MINLNLRRTPTHDLTLDVSITAAGEQAIKITRVNNFTGLSEKIVDDVHPIGAWLSPRLIREKYALEIAGL